MRKPPRIKIPSQIHAGAIIEIRTLATHVMETGNRKDGAGNIIPRDIVHSFTARFDDDEVFSADLNSGISPNPYIAFFMKVPKSGTLTLTWQDDSGVTTVETLAINVT